MSYQNNLLSAMAAVMAPYLRGSAAFTNHQIPQAQSLLEKLISTSSWQDLGRNGHPLRYNPSVRVPFHRGIRPELKKSSAPIPQRVHGYRTPRRFYRKVAEHR